MTTINNENLPNIHLYSSIRSSPFAEACPACSLNEAFGAPSIAEAFSKPKNKKMQLSIIVLSIISQPSSLSNSIIFDFPSDMEAMVI